MPSFLFTDTNTFYPPSPHMMSPATGTTANLWDGQNMITGSGTIAALTVLMPSSPLPGEVVTITPVVAVTALTVKDAVGNAVAGAPTALVAGTQSKLVWTGAAWTKLS